MSKILITDDDENLVSTLSRWLEGEHHKVDTATNGAEALHMLEAFEYDLLVIDWEMPGMSGPEVVRTYRKKGGRSAVLILTARDDIDDKEFGFDSGADDYLTKPFQLRELSARLKALSRRMSPGAVSGKITAGPITLDTQTRVVTNGDERVVLQPLEFDLLEFFMRNPNEVFSAEVLIRRIWSSDAQVSSDSIYSCINRLRRKLGKSDNGPGIKNIHGVGYKFEP